MGVANHGLAPWVNQVYAFPMRRMLSIFLLMLAGLPIGARGELVWEVYANPVVNDWNPGLPGDEIRITYNIFNNSSLGDANNLIQFSVSAGTAQGVYNATAPGGWVVTTQENQTVFSGNGRYLSPGNADTFRIFSTHTNTAQGAANAVAGGGGFPEPFPPLETLVPSEHPATHVVRVRHEAPSGWEGVGELGDVRINGVATNELEVGHGAAVTVSVQRVVGHPEEPGRRLVVKEIRVAEP